MDSIIKYLEGGLLSRPNDDKSETKELTKEND